MKMRIVLVVSLAGIAGLQAQTVTFANLAAGVNAPIFSFCDDKTVEPTRDPTTGTRLPGGSEYLVQLVVLQGTAWVSAGDITITPMNRADNLRCSRPLHDTNQVQRCCLFASVNPLGQPPRKGFVGNLNRALRLYRRTVMPFVYDPHAL